MNEKTRKYPLLSACGLNCGLCPRYHTNGDSKCPGCLGKDFYKKHPTCGILSCSQKKGLDYCYLCDEYPCKKYDKSDKSDSFITHKNQFKDFEKAKKMGIEVYQKELNEKIEILNTLINNYNDGKRKNFYCIAVNLLELSDIKNIMQNINEKINLQEIQFNEKVKQIVSLFEVKAKEKNIELILRKKVQ